jgi:hypothetical protein
VRSQSRRLDALMTNPVQIGMRVAGHYSLL